MSKTLKHVSLVLITSMIFTLQATSIASAKMPKSCGKESSSVRVPSKVLCPDGSPNSDIFKLVKRDMSRTTSLKKAATASQIRQAICADSTNSTGPQVDAAVQYMFAWREWRISGFTYDSIMKTYYQGNWKNFCNGNSSTSDEVKTEQTFKVPSFIGYTQEDFEAWKFKYGINVNYIYTTAFGYNYTISCQVQKRGRILSQSPQAGALLVNSFGSTIRFDIDC
jgi:hypothetical protein